VSGLLIDTDVLIDHLRGAVRLSARDGLHYSVISRCELFAGPAHQEPAVRDLLASLREVRLDGPIAEAAGRIRRETGLPTPDALIAATAIVSGLTLSTRNHREFARVPSLALAP
jgi:predicted nucleic acid-binding protein